MSSKAQKRNKQNKLIYNIINITENSKEKDCIAADKKNEKKYRETIEKLGVTSKEWENTGVMLNLEIPTPPSPSNYERLLEYRRTHVLRPAIIQSEATIYLHERGYQLGIDYQAYQAIEIVNKLQDYERENSLPQIVGASKSKSKDKNCVDLDVLNVSKVTEKKRHSFAQPSSTSNSSSLKNRPFSSFNYGSFKRRHTLDSRKTRSAGESRVSPKDSITGKNQNKSVNEIVRQMNQDESAGKPKARFNTVRRKTLGKSKNQPASGVFLNPTPPSQASNIPISYLPAVENQKYYTAYPNIGLVQPSAPPMPPDYDAQNNSASSIDSLFDDEEMKQFEKKYDNSFSPEEKMYRNNQRQYNGIYPNLENEDENDDVCCV